MTSEELAVREGRHKMNFQRSSVTLLQFITQIVIQIPGGYSLMWAICILNWPLPIEAFQDQCKQTMINKYSNKHNEVKNPNWREADQLAIYKRNREVELGADREQHQLAVRTGFEPGTYGFQIWRSNHSVTLPPLNV